MLFIILLFNFSLNPCESVMLSRIANWVPRRTLCCFLSWYAWISSTFLFAFHILLYNAYMILVDFNHQCWNPYFLVFSYSSVWIVCMNVLFETSYKFLCVLPKRNSIAKCILRRRISCSYLFQFFNLKWAILNLPELWFVGRRRNADAQVLRNNDSPWST